VDRRDLRIAEALLSPEYMIPLARELGNGDPIKGARFAWREVRGLLREWVRHVKQRERAGSDLDVAFSFKHLGIVGTYCEVLEIKDEPWRVRALQSWTSEAPIYTTVDVNVSGASTKAINHAALRAISKSLRLIPFANRALLDGRCWQRVSGELMVNFELRGEMHSVVFTAEDKTDAWIDRKIKKALLASKHLQQHELAWFGRELSLKWAKTGLISSPAGAMVALMSKQNPSSGFGPTLPCNGIPIALTLCGFNEDAGTIKVAGSLDHRVIDGRAAVRLFKMIKEEMECELF
jgi:hypothetical protein